ncbi:MAG: RluA family pseudouridine synthase [Proteobacteria bacterium]|nr:RluA family pseudouridine synthase [Pseudomonadota bacterium]
MADSDPLTPPFRILFEDTHLLVLSKAPGLLSQGDSSGEPSLVDLLRTHFGRNYVGLIHRLDRNTSGLMVVAKRSKSAERLTSQLQSGELKRSYHALLLGKPASNTPERWEHFLFKNPETNEVKVVPQKIPGAKSALLTMTPQKTFFHPVSGDPVTVARFELDTGRSHQIRAQARAKNLPLIGDSKYGTAKSVALFSRSALHSCEISFTHPMSKEPMQFEERYAFDMIHFFSTLLE